jgi:hypothetical protein
MGEIALFTSDVERTAAFYGDLTGAPRLGVLSQSTCSAVP